MKAIFLSDSHLQRAADPGYRALMALLGMMRGPAAGPASDEDGPGDGLSISLTDLFLVGDIFDFWFSKGRRVYPEFREIVNRFDDLSKAGIRIHICEGNHDFFLEDYFSRHLGMRVYEDWAVIEQDGKKLLIGHGDLVDRSNVRYLRLRAFLRSRFLYRLQRLMPLSILWRIARRSSSMSNELMGGAEDHIYEKMREFADKCFREGFDAVILGHCHKAQLTETVVDGKPRVFATLGDWLRHYSYLHYVGGEFILAKKE